MALLVLLAAVPLLWPDIAPLTDLPGHMGRYRVQLDGAAGPLARFFGFEWALIGNLGVDLLVVPLAPIFGLELAVKLIVLAVPAITTAGFLWTAHEAHGRVPPTALFALPLAYNYPLIFGFVNFALSAGLAFLAFAWWLRLTRQGRFALRAATFAPISLGLWLVHVYGWGLLGLLAFAAECARRRAAGRGVAATFAGAAIGCAALTPPVILMVAWAGGGVPGVTGDWLNLPFKMLYFVKVLADRWPVLDLAAFAVIVAAIVAGWRGGAFRLSRPLAAGAALLALVYVAMPRVLLGSAYADMRLGPYLLAVAVLAVRPRADAAPGFVRAVAGAALAFMLVRTAATTASFAAHDRRFSAELAALNHLPTGARVASFVGKPCGQPWSMSRLDHLPALAIVRRRAFVNDQWTLAGAQLLRIRYAAPGFAGDPSQLVVAAGCRHPEWRTLDDALRTFPRAAFDHVWLIDPPAHDARGLAGMTRLWSRGSSALYRIRPPETRVPG